MKHLLTPIAMIALFLLPLDPTTAQEKSVKPGINKPFENPDLKDFLPKFEDESREIAANAKEIVVACKIKPGMTVADVGAGTGLFTSKFAAEVGDKDESIKKDRKQIEGTWRVVALEVNGNKSADEDAKKITVVNGSDGTWTLLSDGKEISKGTSSFDPTKTPKTLDFTVTEGEGKGNEYVGIYELGEKTRKMCFAPPGKERPREFTSAPGSEHILVTFERETTK